MQVNFVDLTMDSTQYPRPAVAIAITLGSVAAAFTIAIVGTVVLWPFLKQEELQRLLLVSGEALLILPIWLYLRWSGRPVMEVVRLRPVSREILILSVGLGFSLAVVIDELDRILRLFIPSSEFLDGVSKELEAALLVQSFEDAVIVAFGAVVAASFVEELVFRGFLQKSLESHQTRAKAIVIASVVFSVIHLVPWVIEIFALALVLGYMAMRTDSIVPSAVVHLVVNGMSITFLNIGTDNLDWYLWHGHVSPLLLVSAMVLLAATARRFQARTSYAAPEMVAGDGAIRATLGR